MANLVPILPRESIYSWITRSFLLSGYATYKLFCRSLFGSEKVKFHPYLNNRITALSRISGISEHELIRSHTLYPIFSTLHGQDFVDRSYSYLLSNKTIPNSVFGLNQQSLFGFHGHKYCPVCVLNDTQQYGFHYWHINHQMPGVCACAEHNCQLLGIESDEGGLDRHLNLPVKTGLRLDAKSICINLAEFVNDVFVIAESNNEKSTFKDLILRELDNRELLTAQGQFRSQEIIKENQIYWQDMPPQSTNRLSIPDTLLTFKYVPNMLRNLISYHCHPIKLLLVAGWLFDCKYTSRTEDPETKSQYPQSCKPKSSSNKNTDNEQVLSLVREGVSHNEIYKRTGKSRVYIKRIASKAGLYDYARGKKVTGAKCRAILRKGLYGIHRFSIAKSLRLSTGTVEQILSTAPDLIDWRKRLNFQVKKNQYREQLNSYLAEHPESTRKEIKASCNAAFFWCYNNDKEWLESLLPPPRKPCVNKVNWHHRDTELITRIKLIIEKLPVPVSISALDKKVGGKRWLTKFISSLPKTKSLLNKLIKSKKVKAQYPGKYK